MLLSFTGTLQSDFIFIAFSVLLVLFTIYIYFASKDKTNNFNLSDLIVDPITKKGSLSKVLQLIGGLTGTFTILWYTVKIQLNTEMLAVYLAALGVSEAFSKWVSVRYNTPNTDTNDSKDTN